MPAQSWSLLHADDRERALFPDLEAALARSVGLAAPRNRRREVHRLEADGRVWFLKVFTGVQWKNRVRLAWQRPRTTNEAAREGAMCRALAAGGFPTPRVVALGRRERHAYFLCAALPGQPLAQRLVAGDPRPLLLAAAEFAGRAFARGFRLPDLATDHVFALDAGGFALLDLHNGSLGQVRRRDRHRALVHAARSLRGSPVSAHLAMRAALIFLRAAGSPNEARWHLSRLEPFATHARYERAGKSAAYVQRDSARSRRELALLARVWPGVPGETVVDSPCGAGRLWPFLRERGHPVLGLDRARAMLLAAGTAAPRINADATRLPLGARTVAGVVVFRFLHHLPTEIARAVVAEATRVADRFVGVTVFRPWSLHAIWRRVSTTVRGRARTRFAHAPARVTGWFAAAGYHLHARAHEGPGRELCVLSFCRARS